MGANDKAAATFHPAFVSPADVARRHRERQARTGQAVRIMEDGVHIATVTDTGWHAPVCYVQSCHGECYTGSGWTR